MTSKALPGPDTTLGDTLLSIRERAIVLDCSPRHVRRLAVVGALPAPVWLGELHRWSRRAALCGMEAGCPPIARAPKGEARRG